MAKRSETTTRKERLAVEPKETRGTTLKSAGARSPGSRQAVTRNAAAGRPAPDAPANPPASGQMTGNTESKLSPEDVYRLIQESAYFKAKARGFAPGHEVQDWIEAEQEVRQRLGGRV